MHIVVLYIVLSRFSYELYELRGIHVVHVYLPIFCKVASLVLVQSYDCPSARLGLHKIIFILRTKFQAIFRANYVHNPCNMLYVK